MAIKFFQAPEVIRNNIEGIQWLSEFASDTILLVSQTVYITFTKCNFIEGNLCAVLGSIFEGLKIRGNSLSIIGLQPEIKNFLNRNNFLDYYFVPQKKDIHPNTSIPFSSFNVEDEIEFENYIKTKLLNHTKLPPLSQPLKNEILKGIFEIYSNALTHGDCTIVFTCGQISNKGDRPELYFTFVDLGKTIKNNVTEFHSKYFSGIDSIIWALKDGNSTKKNNHSGGLGLKVIQEFLSLNNGTLHIVSAEGFWELNKGFISTNTLPVSFPGTIVTLCINLNDTSNYSLTSEELPENLF